MYYFNSWCRNKLRIVNSSVIIDYSSAPCMRDNYRYTEKSMTTATRMKIKGIESAVML